MKDEEPLLFHTGLKGMFSLVRDAVAKIIDPSQIRWISFSHFEADECGSLNEWLAIAPNFLGFLFLSLCPTLREATSCLCALCGSLRQAATLREAAPTRLRSLYSLAHLHTKLVSVSNK
ncbi:hypothetical protein [Nostoc sp.]|uniref:hypothetical protein n=1 Tax=Nostoc sp. TaxID=1180 RepID=UPI002FF8CDA6